MSKESYQDILARAQKPSRYLGTEINSVHKNHQEMDLRFALAFPDLYDIGTSHFGMQILYNIINQHENWVAERFFCPGTDVADLHRHKEQELVSLETHKPLKMFDIIGFSLLYELNYTNILTMLDLGNIPFKADDRSDAFPPIIAGGPCACNPEPVASFFDAFVIGDGEEVIEKLIFKWLEWKGAETKQKSRLLKEWSLIEGVYIPAFYDASYDKDGFQRLTRKDGALTTVKRAAISDLNRQPFPEKPVVPFGKPVHDRLRLEIARGCTRGCRFCQAGMIYRPVRERSPQTVLELARRALAATGYDDLTLLSLSTGDYGCIVELIEHLMHKHVNHKVAISLPSLRAGSLTTDLAEVIKQVRKTGFTIAPEAGSQRLRDVINKNISNEDIFEAVDNAFRLGWPNIKLYFMIGLPTETQDDLHALVDLVKELRQRVIKSRQGGRQKQIIVSVATFIPKAHTPFQWAPQITVDEARRRINWLKNALNIKGIKLKWQNPEVSALEGVWARGDRRLGDLLTKAWHRGCRLDGWSDHFSYDLWQQALQEMDWDHHFFTSRCRQLDEPLPWGHIDYGVSTTFLQEECRKAFNAEPTADCRHGECNLCGVCDFETLQPITYQVADISGTDQPTRDGNDKRFSKFHIRYAKLNEGRFFGHLELANIFQRVLQQVGAQMKYSAGFHPKPKISYQDPLPVGIESEDETLYVHMAANAQPNELLTKLNALLPEGLEVISIETYHKAAAAPQLTDLHDFLIQLSKGQFRQDLLEDFINSKRYVIKKVHPKKGRISIDIRPHVKNVAIHSPQTLQMTLETRDGRRIRPTDLLANVFRLDRDEITTARIRKLAPINHRQ
jgi:radical SAM family uncharacterized protein/radical SAM-linked protein